MFWYGPGVHSFRCDKPSSDVGSATHPARRDGHKADREPTDRTVAPPYSWQHHRRRLPPTCAIYGQRCDACWGDMLAQAVVPMPILLDPIIATSAPAPAAGSRSVARAA